MAELRAFYRRRIWDDVAFCYRYIWISCTLFVIQFSTEYNPVWGWNVPVPVWVTVEAICAARRPHLPSSHSKMVFTETMVLKGEGRFCVPPFFWLRKAWHLRNSSDVNSVHSSSQTNSCSRWRWEGIPDPYKQIYGLLEKVVNKCSGNMFLEVVHINSSNNLDVDIFRWCTHTQKYLGNITLLPTQRNPVIRK